MQKPRKSYRIFVLVVVVILVSLACGKSTSDDGTLDLQIKAPPGALEQGRSFDVVLSMTNTSEKDYRVSEISLPASFLVQVRYDGSFPALSMRQTAGGEGIIAMDLNIAPAGVEVISFGFIADAPGSISGTGTVRTDRGDFPFELAVEVAGSNPQGWEPGSSPDATPVSLGSIPYQAVVQIKAIVEVNGEQFIGWTGSGTLISSDGLVLTNAHVVMSDRFYQVEDLIISLTVAQDGPPVDTYLASIVQADASLDIAVIKPRANMDGDPLDYANLNLPFVPLGDSAALQLGDSLVILGYPGIGGETITLTRGEVSGFTAEEGYGNRAFIKTSATIAGGNSGGLAVNDVGELIGVPTQVGSGDVDGSIVDCRALADTNRDGYIDDYDTCVPTGGFINALRPIELALPLVKAAQRGEVAIMADKAEGETYETEGQVVFTDDFSDPNSGWSVGSSENASSVYRNGEMVISVLETDYMAWTDLTYVYDEMVMTVDARVVSSVGDADFGFVCGQQESGNFTVLEISEDGYYSFWRQDGDEFISLIDWTYADEIAAGGPFTLSAYCGKEGLALAVNGILMAEYYDADFVPGTVGLLAGTFGQAGFSVAYDNFELMIP